ncbi:zinc finger protein OZF-like [Euwallacea similis]|uniref:zinc finger protein OZF-like n=1 Tax=Euwallacea similis TaxID=1736056 RepID=UPI0034506C1B
MHFNQDYNGRFMCPNCNSSYKNKGHLVRHIKYECGVEPQFECHECFRRFCHKRKVVARDSTNNKALICPKCGNTFTRIDNLRRHVNYICGMKPQFKCSYCAYASKHKYMLALHIKTKHVPEIQHFLKYTCDLCGRFYRNRSSLKRHKRLECGVEPKYHCPFCLKRFKHEHHLEQHHKSKLKCTKQEVKMHFIE